MLIVRDVSNISVQDTFCLESELLSRVLCLCYYCIYYFLALFFAMLLAHCVFVLLYTMSLITVIMILHFKASETFF